MEIQNLISTDLPSVGSDSAAILSQLDSFLIIPDEPQVSRVGVLKHRPQEKNCARPTRLPSSVLHPDPSLPLGGDNSFDIIGRSSFDSCDPEPCCNASALRAACQGSSHICLSDSAPCAGISAPVVHSLSGDISGAALRGRCLSNRQTGFRTSRDSHRVLSSSLSSVIAQNSIYHGLPRAQGSYRDFLSSPPPDGHLLEPPDSVLFPRGFPHVSSNRSVVIAHWRAQCEPELVAFLQRNPLLSYYSSQRAGKLMEPWCLAAYSYAAASGYSEQYIVHFLDRLSGRNLPGEVHPDGDLFVDVSSVEYVPASAESFYEILCIVSDFEPQDILDFPPLYREFAHRLHVFAAMNSATIHFPDLHIIRCLRDSESPATFFSFLSESAVAQADVEPRPPSLLSLPGRALRSMLELPINANRMFASAAATTARVDDAAAGVQNGVVSFFESMSTLARSVYASFGRAASTTDIVALAEVLLDLYSDCSASVAVPAGRIVTYVTRVLRLLAASATSIITDFMHNFGQLIFSLAAPVAQSAADTLATLLVALVGVGVTASDRKSVV